MTPQALSNEISVQPSLRFISAGQTIPRLPVMREIARQSVPIIPTVGPAGDFATYIPDFLQASNGLRCRHDDPEMTELAAAMLECVGLLRWQTAGICELPSR